MRTIINHGRYTFNKATKQITLLDYTTIALEKFFIIVDQTNANTTIFQGNKAGYSGTVSGNVITLQFDTTGAGFNNSDSLQIVYEDATNVIIQDTSGNTVGVLGGGILTAQGATNYVISSANSSTVQLAASATFIGTIESVLNYPDISILLTCDQPGILTLSQYIDLAGTYRTGTITRIIASGNGLQESIPINGNFDNITFQNTGTATTTTFNLNVAYGTIDAVNSFGYKNVMLPDGATLQSATLSSVGLGSAINTLGYASLSLAVNGTGNQQIQVVGSNDAATWFPLLLTQLDSLDTVEIITSSGNYNLRTSTLYVAYKVLEITGSISINTIGRSSIGVNAVDKLAMAMDPSLNMPLGVSIQGGLKTDASGAIIISDIPGGSRTIQLAVGSTYIFDTTGYQSFGISTGLLFTATIQGSNDPGISAYTSIYGQSVASAAAGALNITSIGPSITALYPCITRFVKITATIAGAFSLVLRSQPYVPFTTFSDLTFLNGTAPVTGGLAGTLGVGGAAAVGAAQTTNPIVAGGIDANSFTRRIRTDIFGDQIVVGAIPSGFSQNGIQAVAVQDTSLSESGQTNTEMLAAILYELRILTAYFHSAFFAGDTTNDEPQAIRDEPNYFNKL